MTIDLGLAMADFARPLPALNDNYNHFAARTATPRPVGIKPTDLDPFGDRGLFRYPHALYSADFARKDRGRRGITAQRDRARSSLFVDSGGFGFISGAIPVADIVDLRREALVAQERLADAGVVVDVPTACIAKKRVGAETFEKCRDLTLGSIEYALAHRDPGGPRILNMIQGTSNGEYRRWYDAVADAPLDGFGFAGDRRKDMRIVLELLVATIRDGRVNGRSWYHVFGTNQPGVGIFLTAIQRELRALFRSGETRITYDSSTSFRYVGAYNQVVTGLVADGASLRLSNYQLAASGQAIRPGSSWPWGSPIGHGRTMSDFMPSTLASGEDRERGIDETGAMMLSNHSLFVELSALIQANRIFDMEHGDDWEARDTRAIPWVVHKGVERIRGVFERIEAGDFKRAVDHARAGERSLDTFAGVDPGEEAR